MRQPVLGLADQYAPVEPPPRAPVTDAAFRCGDRKKLFVGNRPLRSYLADSGQGIYLRVADQIDGMDLSELLESYSPIGRHAIHPRILLGLIIVGILTGKSSLRDLEHLAICDVRAWWICRGEQPDHSTIGKFIVTHEAWISGEGFQSALKQAIGGLGVRPGDAAIDGTVIESAASRLNMLKKDAARAAADEASRAAHERPDDRDAKLSAESAEKVARAIEQRTAAREATGKPADRLKVAASDPDAVNQPRKDDVVAPSYKPSIVATSEQLIVGQLVDPSSETAAVLPLIEQYEVALGAAPSTLMADAGYHTLDVLALAVMKGIDILCPSGKATGADDVERKSSKLGKREFHFDAAENVYRCPAGETLVQLRRERDRDGRTFNKYGGAPCSECPRKAQCSDARAGRTIKRYDGDELKEAQRAVMAQPAARARYKRRSAIVEPVFGRLREMGLRRFRRRGLALVRAEFALYCIAYNFKRADGIREARIAAFAVLRVHDRPVAFLCWIVTINAQRP